MQHMKDSPHTSRLSRSQAKAASERRADSWQ